MIVDVAGQRPQFSADQALALARDLYGIMAVSVQELPSDRDQNFYLAKANGAAYVLKIAAAAEEEAALALQNQTLLHLAQKPALATAVPRLCPTVDGVWMATTIDEQGRSHFVRLLTHLPGVALADANPQTLSLLAENGRLLGQLDAALLDFTHPAMERRLHWDLQHAQETINSYAQHIKSAEKRALVDQFLDRFVFEVVPHLPELRRSVIHSDGNDHNVIVSPDKKKPRHIVGLIDFGDMVYSCTAFEPAIAAAYAMLDKDDALAVAAAVVGGYHAELPLTEQELSLLPTLIAIRLCISVALSAYQQVQEPGNPYLSISERPAWDLLARLAEIPPALLHYSLRAACGLEPYPQHTALVSWLRANQDTVAPLLPVDPLEAAPLVLDWSVGSAELNGLDNALDVQQVSDSIFARLRQAGTPLGIGRYNEARLVYAGEMFEEASGERRTIHIGLDLFMSPGTPVFAPLSGRVHSFDDNDAPLDYGPAILLAHEPRPGLTFYTLYGHLSRDSLQGLAVGQVIERGQEIGRIGDVEVNGGWAPHLHFQIIGDLLDYEAGFPGVAAASQRSVWLSLCPDPNLIAGFPGLQPAMPPISKQEILAQRQAHLGPSLSLSYRKPLEILRGWGQYLYDENGRAYLDVVNNVCHVGHSHPRVVQALAQQSAVLNTNTRYLHPNIVRYAERLLATLPDPLEVCFFVCSGSEANELALRLARTYTGAEDMIVIDGAYHGNTAALIDISPYKHDGPGGKGTPPHVHKALMPDPYRGLYKGYGRETGAQYAAHVQELAQQVLAGGRNLAGIIAESALGCGGQIILPDGYLQEAFEHVRAAGGVCIVDEVQVGFGRVGTHFWAFETQDVVPDIVTMGKPMGNGHPLAAVVTTRAIADAFANGMEYFNTFGGNPVSCAVGTAVLDVVAGEGLQQNALRVGEHLLQGLTGLMERHSLVGDVRGLGLFIGVELVRDRETLEPAAAEASYIVERMKEEGILLSIDGPLHNVLKLKPPIVFSTEDADFLVHTLDKVLAEDAAQPLE
jgi:4-aminobutyrate aminotransferase-like enzyme/Ser/Thr protein kinase RdoA (MazF antagonist)